jgi:Domain of unknown function (DUF4352)
MNDMQHLTGPDNPGPIAPPAEAGWAPEPPKPPRQRRRWPWILAAIGATLLAGVVAAIVLLATLASGVDHAFNPNATHHSSAPAQPSSPAADEQPAPSSDIVPVGTPLTVTQDGVDAATITVTRVSATQQPADPEFGSRPQHGWFVTAHVKVHALSSYSEGFDYNPLDFYAKSHGGHYNIGNGNAYDAPGSDSELDSGTLSAGESVSGTLVFDLPADHGSIRYAPNLDGTSIGGWRFNAQTIPAAAPAAAESVPGADATAVVDQYYQDLNNHDYWAAWQIGGSNLSGGSGYSAWKAGYATTSYIDTSTSLNSDGSVQVSITATQTDGSVKTYSGTYTVQSGMIASANIQQLS